MNKQFIIDYLKKICFNPKPLSSRPFTHEHLKIWTREGITVFLDKNELQNYNEILKEIITDPAIYQGFSMKDIEKSVQEIISRVLRTKPEGRENKIIQEVDSLVANLNRRVHDWIIVVPLENIELVNRQFKVGDVLLLRFTRYQANRYLSELKSILNRNPNYRDKIGVRRKFIESVKKHNIDPLIDWTCAKVKVRGTLKGAQQVAIRKIETALSCIKLYSYFGDISSGIYFGLKGEIVPRSIRSIIRERKDKQSFNPSREAIGYLFPFKLDETRLNFMRKNGFNKLKTIIVKKKQTDVEKRLINSILWYSKACDIPDIKKVEERKPFSKKTKADNEEIEFFNLSDRFLKLMISLECLLIFGRENKRVNLATRSSYILTDNKEQRKRLQDYVKKRYDTRSKIVHEGSFVASKTETNGFMNYVQSVIISLLIKKDVWRLNTDEDLYQWFEKNRLRDRR